jgi:hypothetical protein
MLAVVGVAVLVLSLGGPTALAQSGSTTTESGYSQKPPKPKEKSGTAPAAEKAAAPAEAAPAASAASPSSSSTLPFTGLDLRWIVAAGALLIGAGVSLRLLVRRQ